MTIYHVCGRGSRTSRQSVSQQYPPPATAVSYLLSLERAHPSAHRLASGRSAPLQSLAQGPRLPARREQGVETGGRLSPRSRGRAVRASSPPAGCRAILRQFRDSGASPGILPPGRQLCAGTNYRAAAPPLPGRTGKHINGLLIFICIKTVSSYIWRSHLHTYEDSLFIYMKNAYSYV